VTKITSRLFICDTIKSFTTKFGYYAAYGNCLSETWTHDDLPIRTCTCLSILLVKLVRFH